jgi:hypothetical protein
MPPDTLENGVGKQGDCGGIDDSEFKLNISAMGRELSI